MKIHFNYLTFLFLLLSGSIFAQTTLDSLSIKASFNFGKSVAVFGGSVSVIPESDSAKVLWEKHLGLTITNYGVPGAGFSSLQGKSMQQQVDEAGVFDIYILWASTNDYNYCIKKIYEINPNATIYFFTSSKAFNDRGAYDPFYTEGMVQHVDMQKMICELHGIPVLDQFLLGGYNIYNKDLYYRDPIHMNVVGYKKLGELQVSFLAFP